MKQQALTPVSHRRHRFSSWMQLTSCFYRHEKKHQVKTGSITARHNVFAVALHIMKATDDFTFKFYSDDGTTNTKQPNALKDERFEAK